MTVTLPSSYLDSLEAHLDAGGTIGESTANTLARELLRLRPQPIETAPTDGTLVVVYGDSGYTTHTQYARSAFWQREHSGRARPGHWRTETQDRLSESHSPPTHWAPLQKVGP